MRGFCGLAVVTSVFFATNEVLAEARDTKEIRLEGKLLRQHAKGGKCKVEIDVTSASVGSTDAHPVEARLVLLQPCVTKIKAGARTFGFVKAKSLRINTRTSSRGNEILEFSAKVYGRVVGTVSANPSGNLVGKVRERPNGSLVGDAAVTARDN